jgi:hypothetical protein
VGPKQACRLSLQVGSRMLTSGFKDMRPKGENVNMKIKKGEVRSRGSLDDGKHPSKCKWFYFCQFLQIYACFGCVVINHKKGGDGSEHGLLCH